MAFNTTSWTLIEDAKRGDKSALETLLERYRAPVIRYVQRCGLDVEAAEDVCQDVFMSLYQKVLPAADPERGRFRALLLTVTKNSVFERIRRQRAQRRGGGAAHLPLEEGLTAQVQPDAVFDREWLSHLLSRALTRLEQEHPSYHAALSGVLLDECSYAEVAEKLGVGLNSVRNNVHRAKQKVTAYLRVEVAQYVTDRQEHETEVGLLNRMLGDRL